MNKHQLGFTEIDGNADFFEKMGKLIELNNQTLLTVKKLSRREAEELSEQFHENLHDIIDTDEEESEIVYPKPTTKEGKDKADKINRLVRYMKTKTDIEDDSDVVVMYDKKTSTFYQPEPAFFKLKKIVSKYGIEKEKYTYYKAVYLHDITDYVKEEMKLLEDTTTGVPSRAQLLPMLIDYISTAIVKKESFSLTMLDIDHFKNINDTYGHPFGDKVLKALAQYVNRSIRHDDERSNDIMSRYGGEEFVFTLNNISFENAARTNERIRGGIKDTLKDFDNTEIGLTCSLGMAYVSYEEIQHLKPRAKKKIEEFANKVISEADKCLYESKHTGRNKVTMVKYKTDKVKDIGDK